MVRAPLAVPVALTALAAAAPAQDATAAWFAGGPIPELRIVLTDAARKHLREEPRQYVRAELRESGAAVPLGVGLKLKGSAGSFRAVDDRPGLTIDVRRFGGDAEFHGLVKFHFNNCVQDPTCLHEALAYEIFRRAGLPAPLVTHARVWLDGRDLGLYVLKEGYDARFVARHFGRADGNLYDGGTNGDVHDDLERDTGDGPLDRSDLKALAAACEESDPARRRQAIAATLDVDRFLSFMAIEIMIGHWDGYTLNPNNYRVYFDGDGHRATFVPHGADQVFGDATADPFAPSGGRVAQVVRQDAEWRAALRRRMKELLPIFDPPDRLIAYVRARAERLRAIAPDLAESWHDLEQRITDRVRFLAEAVERPGPRPFEVGPDGACLQDAPWRAESQCEDVVLQRLDKDGGVRLRIAAGACRHCIGSFRTRVLLPAGRYEFRGSAALQGVVALAGEDNHGACLRISGVRRVGQVGSGERALVFAFEVEEALREVVLVVELRAEAGEAVFPLASLRLARVP
jgi:hypothetical protein